MSKRKKTSLAKKLIQYALSGFYFFEDDEIENLIEKLSIKYKSYNFQYPNDSRSKIRAELMSNLTIRQKITDIARNMFS